MIPRQIISPLLSAFLLPGSGQALNLQWKKAILIALFFLAAWAVVVWLSLAMLGIISSGEPGEAAQQASSEATLYLWIASVVCALLWIYGVLDAWRQGRALDYKDKELLDAINRYR